MSVHITIIQVIPGGQKKALRAAVRGTYDPGSVGTGKDSGPLKEPSLRSLGARFESEPIAISLS